MALSPRNSDAFNREFSYEEYADCNSEQNYINKKFNQFHQYDLLTNREAESNSNSYSSKKKDKMCQSVYLGGQLAVKPRVKLIKGSAVLNSIKRLKV